MTLLYPLLKPRAFTVHELLTVKAPVYSVELEVGVVPLVVYRIVGSDVEQDSVTCVEFINVPPFGEIMGLATFGSTTLNGP